MKKTIFALATIAIFSTGVSMAQRTYNPTPNRQPAPYTTNKPGARMDDVKGNTNAKPGSRMDDIQEDIKIDKMDAIVDLTRKQEKELKRIEDRYDKMELVAMQRRNPQQYQRLQAQKQQEMLNVLNKKQLQKWIAYQQSSRNNRGPVYSRR